MSDVNYVEKGADAVGSRFETRTFKAASAIAKGDWVAFDLDQAVDADKLLFVEPCPVVATVGSKLAFGVALAAAASGAFVDVCVAGYCKTAKVSTSAVAGSALIGPHTTAATAEIEVPGTTTGKVCGVALAADVAGIAPVLVIKSVF